MATQRLTGVMAMAAISTIAFGGAAASAQTAEAWLDRVAASVAETDTLIAQGWFRGLGAGAERKVQVEGRMIMQRLEDDVLGFRLAVDAAVVKPMFDDDPSLLRITYDGRTLTQRDARTGEIAYSGPYNDVGRRYTGFTGLMWRRFRLDDPEAFRLDANQRAALGGEAIVAGVPCVAIDIWDGDNDTPRPDQRLFVGVEDAFPRRFEVLSPAGEPEGVSVFEVSGVRRNIRVTPRLFQAHAAQKDEDPHAATPPRRDDVPPAGDAGLLEIGAVAPDWTLPGPDGETHRLSDYRGRVVVMDFWATWCAPCRLAMPALQELHEAWFGRGVEIFAIATDETGDPAAYMDEMGYGYGLLLNGERVKRDYRVQALPTLYVIGPDGKILHAKRGYQPGFERALASVFAEAAAAVESR